MLLYYCYFLRDMKNALDDNLIGNGTTIIVQPKV